MTKSVDDRIVNMEFNNAQFEKGIGESTKSLDALKKGLDFDQSSKSLLGLGRTASLMRGPLSGVTSGVSLLGSRFSILGIMGFEAIRRITGALIDMGKQIFNNVTGLQAIKAGFSEYETQINAIQTILANTDAQGTTLSEIRDALDELNEYADLTIYNFTEMTRNIGTFTAAGIDLKTSVAGIKGIANLAAVSGSTSQQASTAMYQLSQAIAAGTVRLMDWNSVVNAGMGGEVFQKALKDTARVHGVAIDDIIEREGGFRNSLQRGWLSKEILLESLAKFTGDLTDAELLNIGYTEEQVAEIQKMGKTALDAATKVKTYTQLIDTLKESAQSGWTKSWEYILGDFGEAKALFTEISDTLGGMIGKSADARNEILKGWHDMGGRRLLVDALRFSFEGLVSVMTPIKDAFIDIFPPVTAQRLFELTYHLRRFTKTLTLSETETAQLKTLFSGIFSVIETGLDGVKAFGTAIWDLIKPIIPAREAVFGFMENIGEWLLGVHDAAEATDFWGRIIQGIGNFISTAKNKIVAAAKAVASFAIMIWTYLKPVGEWFNKVFSKINFSDIGDGIKDALSPVIDWFKSLKDIDLGELFNVTDKIGGLGDDVAKGFDFFKKIDLSGLDGFVGKIKEKVQGLSVIKDALIGVKDTILEAFKNAMPNVYELYESVTGIISEALSSIGKAIGDNLRTKGGSIKFDVLADIINTGLLTALVLAVTDFVRNGSKIFKSIVGIFKSTSDAVKSAADSLKSVSGILDEVKDSLQAWQSNLKAKTLLTLAGALAIIAASIVALSFIDPERLTGATAAVGIMMAELVGAMATFEKISTGSGMAGMAKVVIAILALSVSMLMLSSAASKLSELSWEEIGKGTGALAGLMAILVVVTRTIGSQVGGIIKASIGLVGFSLALLLLIIPLKMLAKMDPESLTKGIIAIGAIFAEIGAFYRLAGNPQKAIATGLATVIVAAALLIMAEAVKKFANMDAEGIKQGVLAIGSILAELAIFAAVAGTGKDFLLTSVGLAIMAASIMMFAKALLQLSDMPADAIQRGIVSLAVGLAVLVATLRALPTDALTKSLGLTIAAQALLMIGEAIASLSTLSWAELAVGLVGLAGALAIIAGGLYLMSGTFAGSVALLLAAAALTLLAKPLKILGSMSLQQIGVALLALVGVFAVLGVAGLVLTPVVPVILALAAAILLLGIAVVAIGAGAFLFATAIATLVGVGAAGTQILIGLITELVTLLPFMAEKVAEALMAFITKFLQGIPMLLEVFKDILLKLLDVIIAVIPPLMTAFGTLITSIVDTIVTYYPVILQAGFDLIMQFLTGIRDNIGGIATVVTEILVAFMEAIGTNVPILVEAAMDMVIALFEGIQTALAEKMPILTQAAYDTIILFIDNLTAAISENTPRLIESIQAMGGAIVDGLVAGISTGAGLIWDAIHSLAITAIDAIKAALGIDSPSKIFIGFGENTAEGFGVGITNGISMIKTIVKELGDTAVESMSNAISNVSDAFAMDSDLSPTIRPVLDLSEIEAGKNEIAGLLSPILGLNMGAAAFQAAQTAQVMVPETSATKQEEKEPIISLTQINNSPEALDRLEIYRQTRNQLATLKGYGLKR